MGALGQQFDGVFNRAAQVHVDLFEFQLAGFDLGEIEHIVDDAEQVGAGALHGFGVFALGAGQAGFEQQLGHAKHAVHRCADLVAHARKERALGVVGRLGLLTRGAQRFFAAVALGHVACH